MASNSALLGEVNEMFDRAEPYGDDESLLSADQQELARKFFEAYRAIGKRHMPGFNKRVEKAHRLGQQLMRAIG